MITEVDYTKNKLFYSIIYIYASMATLWCNIFIFLSKCVLFDNSSINLCINKQEQGYLKISCISSDNQAESYWLLEPSHQVVYSLMEKFVALPFLFNLQGSILTPQFHLCWHFYLFFLFLYSPIPDPLTPTVLSFKNIISSCLFLARIDTYIASSVYMWFPSSGRS